MTRLRAVRGATTLDVDSREEIVTRTQEMLRELIDRNRIEPGDFVSMIFTATDDLHAEFPAAAARMMGLKGIPLLCARELHITPDESDIALERCIRVLIHYYSEAPAVPVYLYGAARLLDDPKPL